MTGTGGAILNVDDEAATIELRSDYLGGKRLAVACAHSFDEALAELDSERPDAVLISAETAGEHMARARSSVGLS